MTETHRLHPLFEPTGVLIAGASTHPGKFGFVSLHNVLAAGYQGNVFATNREGSTVLGVETLRDVDDLEENAVELVFVCTPASVNIELLQACAAKGIRAAFITSAGYGESGDEGRIAQDELVAEAQRLGIVLAGPNGQGIVSTPAKLCAQIVAPYPPRGRISVASQSGNLVSSFMNYAVQTGVGIARAVSAGNAAMLGVDDYLDYFAQDPQTAVSLAYLEGLSDGRAFFETAKRVTERHPLVVVKGGATSGGQRAAASHTGSLASDDRVFDGACRQAGISRALSVEEAFDAAATFASQPLPRGPRTVVMTTAGGWGVLTADAITRGGILELTALPADLFAFLNAKLPARWSRNNPVDLAGGETRDTIPEVLDAIIGHQDVDAVIYLGLGIQSNQARLERDGGFYPDFGLARIVDFHERQDARYAQAAVDASRASGKPVLCVTELAVADPQNAGVATLRDNGVLCYSSAERAVRALEHLWTYSRYRHVHG